MVGAGISELNQQYLNISCLSFKNDTSVMPIFVLLFPTDLSVRDVNILSMYIYIWGEREREKDEPRHNQQNIAKSLQYPIS